MGSSLNKVLDIITQYVFTLAVLGYIFYEEIVWERFAQPIFQYVQSLKLLKKLEVLLESVNGVVILITFVLLFVITEVQGIYAGMLLLRGEVLLWAIIYVGKVPIAAFTFWLFRVTKPKLMEFSWFETTYNFIIRWIDWVKATNTYKNIKLKASEIRNYIKDSYLQNDSSYRTTIKSIYFDLKTRFRKVLKK